MYWIMMGFTIAFFLFIVIKYTNWEGKTNTDMGILAFIICVIALAWPAFWIFFTAYVMLLKGTGRTLAGELREKETEASIASADADTGDDVPGSADTKTKKSRSKGKRDGSPLRVYSGSPGKASKKQKTH